MSDRGQKLAGLASDGTLSRLLQRVLLFEDQGGRCWLCGGPMLLTLDFELPGAATRDHVIPKRDGGSDDLSNIRLAHMSCNSERGCSPVSIAPAQTWRGGLTHLRMPMHRRELSRAELRGGPCVDDAAMPFTAAWLMARGYMGGRGDV